MVPLRISLLFCLVFLSQVSLQAQDTLRTYIFGHSLINHEFQVNPTPSDETSVPHWFHFLATEAGRRYEVAGQYGFLSTHVNLPPLSNWGFDVVAPAWDDASETFGEAGIDNILTTPGNFIQYQAPDVDYFNQTFSPIEATDSIFDWCNVQQDSLDLYIYENWPDMAGFLNNGFPPTPAEWAAYNADLNGNFHNWFLTYHDSMVARFPNQCVSMIPTGPLISSLLSQSPFDQIPVDSLYEDDAPHGRPTIYFLAALVTYMAMYEEQAPLTYTVPPIIHSTIRNNYSTVVGQLWAGLQSFNFPNGDSRVFCSTGTVLSLDETNFWLRKESERVSLYWSIEEVDQIVALTVEAKRGEAPWGEIRQIMTPSENDFLVRDQAVEVGWNYYRLRTRYLDSSEAYSDVLKAWYDTDEIWQVFPNPVEDRLYVRGKKPEAASLMDAYGRELKHWTDIQAGMEVEDLPSGWYLLRLEGKESQRHLRILKQ
ncbi:MAG: T9SS type A sorting domain-containing protein [Bacteroidota bacterium]